MGPAPGCWDCTSGRLLPRTPISDLSSTKFCPQVYRGKGEPLSYLKSCMKWQIGQATSLYLCVASGINGYPCPISPPFTTTTSSTEYPLSDYSSRGTHTTKHTVNHGHLVIQCALQLPPVPPNKKKKLLASISIILIPPALIKPISITQGPVCAMNSQL